MTLVAVGAAGVLVKLQKPLYKSQALVLVQPAAAAAGSGLGPNMATEEAVASSAAVLASASDALSVPIAELASGLSVSVPGTTSVLQIGYTAPGPSVAQERAQAIAQAYVSYRSAPPVSVGGASPGQRAAASAAPTAALITPASLPTSPTSPKYAIDLIAALIVGLALGIGSAALRDYADDRLRGPLDLEEQAAAPVLAVIPAFRSARRDPRGQLVMVRKPGSVVAEAYRSLRTRLMQMATARNAKTLLVTSPGWEDKSTVAVNLAVALAQSGREVVLVCGDVRWGRAHQLLLSDSGDVIRRLAEGRTSLAGALQPTEVPGLRLLPPGVISEDPAWLQGPDWRTALSVFERHADIVLIEAPPLMAGPDFHWLAENAEMIIIVADARRSNRTQLRLAMREVEAIRDRLAGCVLDNVGKARHSHSGVTAREDHSPWQELNK